MCGRSPGGSEPLPGSAGPSPSGTCRRGSRASASPPEPGEARTWSRQGSASCGLLPVVLALSLGLFPAEPLLGFTRKLAGADPDSAAVEVAGPADPDDRCGHTVSSRHCDAHLSA